MSLAILLNVGRPRPDNRGVSALAAGIAGTIGVAVGSFLNVVVHRVPRGLSIVRPASACPSCDTPIAPRDNIPVLSYLLLRGRCRHCSATISPRYALVELATAAVWVLAALRFGDLEAAAFVALASTVLLALSAIDLEHRRIPNVIVLPATAAALVWLAGAAVAKGEPRIIVEAASSGAAYFALLFVIAVVSGGMGFGDVKLAGFIGVAAGRFGWEAALLAVFSGIVIGGLAAIAALLAGRSRKDAIPFGPMLGAGGLVAMFAGPSPVRNWLGM